MKLFKNMKRDQDIRHGYFLFYIIQDDTNIRNRSESGEIIVYSNYEYASVIAEYYHSMIRVSEYHRIFGGRYGN